MKQPLEIAKSVIEVDLVNDVSDVVTKKILASENEDGNGAFFVCDLGEIVQKYKLWLNFLPRVKASFEVKCNTDPAVLAVLSQLDVAFKCMNKGEMKTILEIGVDESKLIYSSPCKLSSQLKFAAANHIELVEFESEIELHKIKSSHANARLVLKILPTFIATDSHFINYGCYMTNVASLLSVAKQLDLNVVGISFQTRNGCCDLDNITDILSQAHLAFQLAERVGFSFNLLDIGEFYPRTSEALFQENCLLLQDMLDNFFPHGCGIKITAEASRFFTESAFTLATKVIDKTITDYETSERENSITNPNFVYYLSDGIFGSFGGLLYNNVSIKPALIDCGRFSNEPTYLSDLLGPTNDSLDCILQNCYLPELFVGEWIMFKDMGAYTMTNLNDDEITRPVCHYTMSAIDWVHLCCSSSNTVTSPFNVSRLPPVEAELADM